MRTGRIKTLHIPLGDRTYKAFVGGDVLQQAGRILSGLGFAIPPVLVSSGRILELHGQVLVPSLERAFGTVKIVRIGDGERFKTQKTVEKIYRALLRAGADRNSWLLAFGGGVVGDVTGFAAATFMRGIRYVSAPTTLLSQVDSSIGGKVGINVSQGKNLIGAFHHPGAVLSDTGTLRTLPPRELASGLYEVLKCGAIRSEPLIRYIENRLPVILSHEPTALRHIVLESCRIKAEIVTADEREDGERMILNFGHTVGHALEAATDYRRFKHGEAIAWGMMAALRLAAELGVGRESDAARLEALIGRITPLPSLNGISLSRLWNALRRDKKIRSGSLHMVLIPSLGRTQICKEFDPGILRRFLRRFLAQRERNSSAGVPSSGSSR